MYYRKIKPGLKMFAIVLFYYQRFVAKLNVLFDRALTRIYYANG